MLIVTVIMMIILTLSVNRIVHVAVIIRHIVVDNRNMIYYKILKENKVLFNNICLMKSVDSLTCNINNVCVLSIPSLTNKLHGP